MSTQVETNVAVVFTNRNRTTVLFRVVLVIPILVFLGSFGWTMGNSSNNWAYSSGLLFAPVLLALVFRGKYPSYVYALNSALLGLNTRVAAYLSLLVDTYPTIEVHEAVEVRLPEISEGRPLNRWLPLVKWFLAIPLYVVGAIYAIYAMFVTVFAWFAILLSGNYPDWCARPVAGTIAYWNRVIGYAFLLVTDEYPSFAL